MLIEIEKTPNPATRKFLPGRTVMETGGRDFASPEAAEASPLADALFATGMVDGVYFGRDFVSVSAAPTVEWNALEPEVLTILLDHFMLDAPLFRQGSAADIAVAADAQATIEEDPADADIIEQIKELLDTRVRPAVAQDGGDIVYRGFKGGTLYLAMQGACAGCPSSAVTLKRGVESLIRHYVPEVETIEAV
ncbi:NifU family protein [Sphingomonas xanthus]|uniref:NifU family protein n=1 Tax=Sphingomonas xanthus TaxID=2594473 RepID=A0A516ISV8_9SPHN|nr:NifU family protein [Sphingomonas xanthus]QDP19985.1 NifU family protein [Sphingomonas xanthus]